MDATLRDLQHRDHHRDERINSGVPGLRAIFASVIAISVAFAPVTLARAAMQMHTEMHAAASADMAADTDMADCHGTMNPGAGKDHPCCDQPPKAPCADKSDCLGSVRVGHGSALNTGFLGVLRD